MAKVKNPDGLSLRDDPRVRDRVIHNRLRIMVEHEACDRAWGCALYMLNRLGRISNEQREAGDRYHKIIEDWKATQQLDPDELNAKEAEFQMRRIEKARRRRDDMVELLGGGRMLLDDLILSDIYPATERERKLIRAMLEALAIFFNTGRTRPLANVV